MGLELFLPIFNDLQHVVELICHRASTCGNKHSNNGLHISQNVAANLSCIKLLLLLPLNGLRNSSLVVSFFPQFFQHFLYPDYTTKKNDSQRVLAAA
jgi:hypothetical protein